MGRMARDWLAMELVAAFNVAEYLLKGLNNVHGYCLIVLLQK